MANYIFKYNPQLNELDTPTSVTWDINHESIISGYVFSNCLVDYDIETVILYIIIIYIYI